jgi:hypothetical protein
MEVFMKRIYILFLVLLFSGLSYGTVVATFNELVDPRTITVDKDRIFITDGVKVYIYSLKDYTLRHSFGKKGEGPREFNVHPDLAIKIVIRVRPDYILVNSLNKVSYFTREGKFIKEARVIYGLEYEPIGEHFVAIARSLKDSIWYWTINIFDSNYQKGKELVRRKTWSQAMGDVDPIDVRTPRANISGNKIIVSAKKIHIFNQKGEKLHTINYNFEKIKITNKDKKDVLGWYENSVRLKQWYAMLKPRIKFSKYFPDIRDCAVADEKIYVMTFKKEEGKREFVIFDPEGKFLKKVMLPFREIDAREWYAYTIKNDKLYQLIDMEEEEMWGLSVVDIR